MVSVRSYDPMPYGQVDRKSEISKKVILKQNQKDYKVVFDRKFFPMQPTTWTLTKS